MRKSIVLTWLAWAVSLILNGCAGPQPKPTAALQGAGQATSAPAAQAEAGPQAGRGNSPGNIVNKGLAAIDGDWIYYRNEADGGRLYKMKVDGTGKAKLSDNKPVYINALGGWVYYAKDGSTIYRVRTNGKDEAPLTTVRATYVSVVDGWVYYRSEADKGAIYRVKADGSGATKLNSHDSRCINVVDGWIYYVDAAGSQAVKGLVYKMKVDGSGQVQLGKMVASDLNVAGGYIYYTEHPEGKPVTTGRMKADGSEATAIAQDNWRYLNVAGDWMYCAPDKDSGYLYRARLDGSGATKLSDDKHVSWINVVGDWVYYDVAGGDPQWVKVDGNGRHPVD